MTKFPELVCVCECMCMCVYVGCVWRVCLCVCVCDFHLPWLGTVHPDCLRLEAQCRRRGSGLSVKVISLLGFPASCRHLQSHPAPSCAADAAILYHTDALVSPNPAETASVFALLHPWCLWWFWVQPLLGSSSPLQAQATPPVPGASGHQSLGWQRPSLPSLFTLGLWGFLFFSVALSSVLQQMLHFKLVLYAM